MKFHHWKVIAFCLVLFDIAAIALSYFFGLWLRFDFHYTSIPTEYMSAYVRFLPWYLIMAVIFFWFMRMYRGIWRFAGFHELVRYGASSLIASLVHSIVITIAFGRMPFSYYIVGAVMQLILVVGVRFSYRFYTEAFPKKESTGENADKERVMIIGAGAAGRNVVRELLQSEKLKSTPCCIIDDNTNKWNRFIDGIPVVGGRNNIISNAKKIQYRSDLFLHPYRFSKE